MSDEKVSEEEEKALKELKDAAGEVLRIQRLNKYGPNFKPEPPFCSFCSKGSNEVKVLIPGDGAHICDECVEIMKGVIENEYSN